MDPEKQVNKSNQDVHVWRMKGDNGDDGDNNGESLILLLLFWGGTYCWRSLSIKFNYQINKEKDPNEIKI